MNIKNYLKQFPQLLLLLSLPLAVAALSEDVPKIYCIAMLLVMMIIAFNYFLNITNKENDRTRLIRQELHELEMVMKDRFNDAWACKPHPRGATVIEDVNGCIVATFADPALAQRVCDSLAYLNIRLLDLRNQN